MTFKKPWQSSFSHEDSPPLYPILGISYFFLHIWAQNFERGLRFSLLLRPYLISLSVIALIWQVLAWKFRSAQKAAFFAFFLAFCFFSYGHFRNLLLSYVMNFEIPQRFFISIFILVVVVIPCFFVAKSKASFKPVTSYLNIATGILLFFPLSLIVAETFYPYHNFPQIHEKVPAFTKAPNPLPDIYYIILDEYGREDSLRNEFNYDNTPFLHDLKKRGFFIADRSRSNYLQTDFSLSSSLNMRYLTSIEEDFPELVKNSLVSRALKQNLGYRYIFVNSGCVLSDSSPTADQLISYVGSNDVELLLANTTMINAFTAFFFSESWRYRHWYNFKELGEVPKEPGAKFIFAHILLPHPPFVFSSDGSARKGQTIRFTPLPFNVGRYHEAYPEQLTYLNTLVLKLVDQIVSGSRIPPIIILQSDHGVDPILTGNDPLEYIEKRSANFTALLLPGDGIKRFGSDITPVNIFRILFSHYFGADLPPLENQIFSLTETEDLPIFEPAKGIFS